MISRSGTLITLIRSGGGVAASEWALLLCLIIVALAIAAQLAGGPN